MNGSSGEIAQRYLAAGLCVLPIMANGTKRPLDTLGDWKQWQHKLPAPQEVAAWFAHCDGFGVVCGRTSGYLEVVDFDDGTLFDPWSTIVELAAPGLLARLPVDQTPGDGYHIYLRCLEIAGNMKLARAEPDENGEVETLIETRGEGGFIVVPPTAARYHERRKAYRMLRGDLTAIPEITPQERAILLEAATTFNRYTPRIVEVPKEPGANAGNRPGDRWAADQTWAQILEPHGWRALGQRGQTIYWQRPGKDGPGNSATTGHNGHDVLYVFSSNALPFESEAGYSKFTAFAFLNHGGDFTAATKEVVALGYGDPPEAQGEFFEPEELAAEFVEAPPNDNEIAPPLSGQTHKIELLRADAGNAARLARLFGDRLRFVPTWGWLAWDGKRWDREQGVSTAARAARRVALSFYADAAGEAEAGDEKKARKLSYWAHSCLARSRIEAMLSLGESELKLWARPGEFDLDPWLLNVDNGILDLRTGLLRPHDPAALMTRLCPVSYDPTATHPLWASFLATATDGDTELASYLQRFAGYCLTGSTAEEVVALLLGPAATGKTTFVGALLAVLGDYGVKATFDTFLQRREAGAPRPDIAILAGARFVAACESEAKHKLAEVVVKELSGGDPVTARFLFRDQFTFKPAFKILLACNESPAIRDDDTGIWRRLRRVPFEHEIPEAERDPEVKRRLCDPNDAGPAILAWAIRGCLDWQSKGLGYPPRIRTATDDLRDSMDPLADFITECCTIDPDAKVAASALRQAYEQWAKDHGQKETVSGRQWGERLRKVGAEQGFTGPKEGRLRAWVGIGLLAQPTAQPTLPESAQQ